MRVRRPLLALLLALAFAAAGAPHPSAAAQEAGTDAGEAAEQEAPDAGADVLSAWDTLRTRGVGGAEISPDGTTVLYTVSSRDMDSEQLDSTTQIWKVGVDGEGRRQMTRGDEDASSPQWYPSGDRFAFLTRRGEKSQVWAMYVDGGEAWQLTDHEEGVESFAIAPDGESILFTARDPESDEDKERVKLHDDAVLVDTEFRWTHLWVHDLESEESRRLTEGEFTVSDPRWSPASDRIAFVTRPNTLLDQGWDSDIRVTDLEGDSRILFENPGPDTSPRWSPDGSTIAFTAHPNTSTTTWYSKLYLIPAEGGEPDILLEDFDLDVGAPIWAPDGRDIYWSTGQRTSTELFSVQVGTGEWRARDAPPGANFGFELAPDGGRWVWVHSSPAAPGELMTAPAEDLSQARTLTDANAWIRDEGIRLARVEVYRWNNSDGQEIEGVLHYPVGYEEGTAYPLVVNPHGGPSGAVLTSFNSTNQFLAGNGFLVFQPNFRGSSNYGQEFLNANRNYWGLRDYDDIMTGVDALVAAGLADADRMVAYGWSYGGYMTFWMSTQTDRFKMISPGAGLSNLYSMYSTTDISNYLGWFFGTPWSNEDIYRRLSPIRHVDNVTADILIMHGAQDARVPPEQAVEFYRALKDLGKPVVYVSYPRQGHGIGEPRLQMDRLRRYVFAFAESVGTEVVSERPEDNPWLGTDTPFAPASDEDEAVTGKDPAAGR